MMDWYCLQCSCDCKAVWPDHCLAPSLPRLPMEDAPAPMTDASAVGTPLELPVEPSAPNKRLLDAFLGVCKVHGGPRQYLQKTYASADSQIKFAAGLLEMLPLDSTVVYHAALQLPAVQEADMAMQKPLLLHPAMFSYHSQSTLKGHPQQNTCCRLAEEILQDGFATGSEPLLVKAIPELVKEIEWGPGLTWGHPAGPGMAVLPPQSLACVKGSARVSTVLCLLSLVLEDESAGRLAEAPC